MPSAVHREIEAELDWLYGTQLFGMKLGLEGISQLLHLCGVEKPTAHTRVIHVAGTNGKGSTCATIERVARAAGYRTGLFTSPHLVRFHERLRVNGEMISNQTLLKHLRELRTLVSKSNLTPTFFELVFALALLYFLEQGCDLLILETGLGGRLDATNALAKDVAVITPIGLDHTQYLGDSLAEIAGEKAGIIRTSVPTIAAKQQPEAAHVLEARCAELASPLLSPPPAIDESWSISLIGQHQRENTALALAALRALPDWEGRIDREGVAAALRDVHWAGRFEHLSLPRGAEFILDGAHNPHAIEALVSSWKQTYNQPTACLFACSADKELDLVVDLLDEIVSSWHLAPVNSPRIMDTSELGAIISERSKKPLYYHDSLESSLDAMDPLSSPSLVCGSFFLIGELKALLEGSRYRQTSQ